MNKTELREMTELQLERSIQSLDRQRLRLRDEQLRAHAVLDEKIQERTANLVGLTGGQTVTGNG